MSDKSMLKKIKNYIVSMEQTKLLGRGRMGDVRIGIRSDDKKMLVFKIVPFPLGQRTKEIIEVQQKLNTECIQTIHPVVNSSTKCYIPYQHLLCTLHTKWNEYKGDIDRIHELCSEMFYCYSYFVGLGLGHGNIKPTNIGFTSEGKLKFMDIVITTGHHEDTMRQDMSDFGEMMLELCDNKARSKYGLGETLSQMVNNRISWMEVFDKFGLIARLTKYIKEKNDHNVHHRVRILLGIAQRLNSTEMEAYLACSIYVYLKLLLSQQLTNITHHKSYYRTLSDHFNKIKSITRLIPYREYFGISEVIRDRKWFGVDVGTQLQILMCLIPEVNHKYISESLVVEASEDEMEVMVRQYSSMVDLEGMSVVNE